MATQRGYLVINAGSSSLKFSVFHRDGRGRLRLAVTGQISGIGGEPCFEARDDQRRRCGERRWNAAENPDRAALLAFVLDWVEKALPDTRLVAAGHRVVHGGSRFTHPVVMTPAILDELEDLVPLAPLHQPHNVQAIRCLAEAHPSLPQVACFDTAFHSTQSWQAQTYALPQELAEQGVRRYGFHGLSYEYVSRHLADTMPKIPRRLVIAHLGNGASLCAVHNGRSVDTTMGFSTLEGVPMGTRPGNVDAGLLLYLMREKAMGLDDIEDLLYRKSGLLGVSGLSNDMRVLLESEDHRASDAVDLFCWRVAKEVAALATSMGGIDALVFTAGIGENSPPVRSRVCHHLGWLGVRMDPQANDTKQRIISVDGSAIDVLVIPTDEERMIATHTMALLDSVARESATGPSRKKVVASGS